MCLLFETIRIVNGKPQNLLWHESRMNRARKEIWGTGVSIVNGPEIIVPAEFSDGVVRCNIYYGREVQQVSFKRYEQRIIRSLKMIPCNTIDYHLKFSNRMLLDSLFALRGAADEIIILKNGLITDTSMSNLIFKKGNDWYTPAIPLLKGTCRDRLIAYSGIIEQDIRPWDLCNFSGCKLINAMRDHQEETLIPISEIT